MSSNFLRRSFRMVFSCLMARLRFLVFSCSLTRSLMSVFSRFLARSAPSVFSLKMARFSTLVFSPFLARSYCMVFSQCVAHFSINAYGLNIPPDNSVLQVIPLLSAMQHTNLLKTFLSCNVLPLCLCGPYSHLSTAFLFQRA
jgi:hypothetical protein